MTDYSHGPVTWRQTSEYEVTPNPFYFKKRVKKLDTSNLKDLETTVFESHLISEETLLNLIKVFNISCLQIVKQINSSFAVTSNHF
jgi:hypothetical protein